MEEKLLKTLIELKHLWEETNGKEFQSIEFVDEIIKEAELTKNKMITQKCQLNECPYVAEFLGAQSANAGKTIDNFVIICKYHADEWNDGGDWDAPIVSLEKIMETYKNEKSKGRN